MALAVPVAISATTMLPVIHTLATLAVLTPPDVSRDHGQSDTARGEARDGPTGASAAAPPIRRFVLSGDAALNVAIFFPAGDLSAFLGGSLPGVTRRRSRHWAALGARLTGTLGTMMLTESLDRLSHGVRVHFTITGAAGRRGRLAYSAGVGPALAFRHTPPAHPHEVSPFGVDVEGRLGYLFGQRPGSRLVGMVGGTLRVAVSVERHGALPLPSLGLFIGIAWSPLGSRR